MTTYDVFIESSPKGASLAHVVGLPGCFVVGIDLTHVLEYLPQEIHAYLEDRIRHGEPVDIPARIELVVVEEHSRTGRFHADDRAALFGPERKPLTGPEVERFLALARDNRADLLALVAGFSDSILDWRNSTEAMTIRKILYHIGRAELWFISRVTEPDQVPDWRVMPVRRFLDETRKTFEAHFQTLSEAELQAVSHPPGLDGDNTEAWTARKALRRALEHEREHIKHIKQILRSWREHLLARLAASRSSFVWQLVSLDEAGLDSAPIYSTEDEGSWTAKDLVPHVAAWDQLYARRSTLAAQGRWTNIEPVELDQFNAEMTKSRDDWTLEEAIYGMMNARDSYLAVIGSIPDAELHRRFRLRWGRRATLATWARWRFRHDDRHTEDLLDWRARTKPLLTTGPKAVLQEALESGRQEMLATLALVPVEERQVRPVCGIWTLKDVLGHVADWEWYGVEEMDGGPSRRSLGIRFKRIQDWNEAHAAARQDQPWDNVYADFQAARLAMGQALEKLSQDDLARTFAAPWNRNWTVYRWIHLWAHHEREHAADLRLNLNLAGWPARLLKFE